MRTSNANGPASPAQLAKDGPGCCGPVKNRLELLRKVSQQLGQGHQMIAQMYASVAADMPDTPEGREDREGLQAKAKKHTDMAEETFTVLVPNDFLFDDEAPHARG